MKGGLTMGTFLPILFLVLAYLLGSIPFGYLIGKLRGTDIRKHGSHNIGATNALRTLGKKWGFLVFFLDIFKATLFVFLTKYIVVWDSDFFTLHIHPMFYGLASFIGHLYPIFLKFKGGKGVSCYLGLIAVYYWPFALIALAIFSLTLLITKYVSLGSILAVTLTVPFYWILKVNDPYMIIIVCTLSTLVIFKHRSNIKRLFTKTENKTYIFKK